MTLKNKNIVLCTNLSEYYGPVVFRYVGTIDMSEALKFNDVDDLWRWTQKYHPRHFFRSCDLRNLGEYQGHGGHMKWEVWVAVKEDNPNWRARPGTGYYERLQKKDLRKKYLPIALPEKRINKWIAASESLLGLYTYSY